jgi:bromodomain-containing protein 7/9
MDFSTIKTKIEAGVYNDLSELIVDAKLIAENAILYNEPDTIFYAAAQK